MVEAAKIDIVAQCVGDCDDEAIGRRQRRRQGAGSQDPGKDEGQTGDFGRRDQNGIAVDGKFGKWQLRGVIAAGDRFGEDGALPDRLGGDAGIVPNGVEQGRLDRGALRRGATPYRSEGPGRSGSRFSPRA